MRTLTLAGAAIVMAFGVGACGGGEETAAPQARQPAATSPPQAEGPFGPACPAAPKDGEGSFSGMADDPVATAASNNPVLSTLVSAVQQADLADTLNSAEDITVFAPTNDAFAKIPEKTLNQVLADKDQLTAILTYHVLEGRYTPEELAGSFTTLQGGTVDATRTGESYQVDDAKVVCGNVRTANATVYIIDTVLMPEG
ncbi:MAG: fasciclin domain-containing protein [Streptosporangiales bacterium]|nr:fasciclin domain-containing protein [Streptosporangiales bacterium]